MASIYGTVTVGTTAVVVVAASSRDFVRVKNNHATNILYLGFDANVTTANGYPLAAGQEHLIENYDGPVYGIASAAGTDVRYTEIDA